MRASIFKILNVSSSIVFVMIVCHQLSENADAQFLPAYDPTNSGNWYFNEIVSDEFNGTQLDTSKWHVQGTGDYYFSNFIGRAPSQFSPENVRVESGNLKISTRWEPEFDFSQNPGQGGLAYENFTTAAVISKRQVDHGYLEIRAKAADTSVASAFWLLGNQAELDVFEHLGKPSLPNKEHLETEIWSSIRDWSPGGNGDPTWTDRRQLPFRVAGDFHTYGLEWNQSYLNFHIDGQLFDSVSRAEVEAANSEGWTIKDPMRIWFDSETFPWHGVPEESDLPKDYEIDYIRVWQQAPTSNPSGLVFADDFSESTLDLVWNTGGGFFHDTENENVLLSTFGGNWGTKGDDVGILDSDIGYATFRVSAEDSNPIGGNFNVGTSTFQNTNFAISRINLASEGAGTYELVWNNSGVAQDFEMLSGWTGQLAGNSYVWIVDGDTANPHWGTTDAAANVSLAEAATTFGFWHASATSSAVIDDFAIYDTLTPAGLAGDFDGDGDVDGADYLEWTRDPAVGILSDWDSNYGISGTAGALSSVPEPSAACLMLCLLLSLGMRRGGPFTSNFP